MKAFKIISILLLSLALCSCRQEQSEDIYILYTNDVASTFTGNIGYAGVKAYKNKLEEEHSYVSLVDAGDFLDGDIAALSRGEFNVEVMNAVGYDVAAVGNQEFSVGLSALANDVSESKFTYISCNLR